MNELKRLLRTYGTYKILAIILQIDKEEIKENYSTNLSAVIHKDIKILEKCVNEMSYNSFLRANPGKITIDE